VPRTPPPPDPSPVLDDPVLLALGGDSEAHRQHGVIDVVAVAVLVVVHT